MTRVKETVYHPPIYHTPESQREDLDRLAVVLDDWRRQAPKITPTPSTQGRKPWEPVGIPFYSSEWFDLQLSNPQYLSATRSSPN